MSEIVKSEYNALDEQGNYKKHYFTTSADQVVGLGRMKNTEYQVGDVVYSDTNNKVALKCTTSGTTSNTELDVGGRAVGESVEDGTCVWKLVSRVSDGMPVGFKYFDWVKEIPVGALGALGALYNRGLYADLWKSAQENKQVITEAEWQALAQANDGNVPWYSDGDGSTTFRVPALKCWVKGASGIEEVGNYLEAGLPNAIGGTYSYWNGGALSSDGALMTIVPSDASGLYGKDIEYKTTPTVMHNQRISRIGLDLSKSNSTYGNSDTVQPPSLVGIWLIKAFGTVTNVGNADIANVMQAVEQVQRNSLPLSGGVMQGELSVRSNLRVLPEHYNHDSETYEGGQIILENGNEEYPQKAIIDNYKGQARVYLAIGDKLEEVPDSSGVIEAVLTKIDRCIRYTSGLQICWGASVINHSGLRITFPLPFVNKDGYTVKFSPKTITATDVAIGYNNDAPNSFFAVANGEIGTDWLAIGWWK